MMIIGKSVEQDSVIFEKHQAPQSFIKLDSIPSLTKHQITLNLSIALKTERLSHQIDDLLSQISDPSLADYQNYLSDSAAQHLLTPDPLAVSQLSNWLHLNQFSPCQFKWSPTHHSLTLFNIPLSKVEFLLNTTYSFFLHPFHHHLLLRTDQYSLPRILHTHIDFIQPTTSYNTFINPKKSLPATEFLSTHQSTSLLSKLEKSLNDDCLDSTIVTNICLRKLYKTFDYKVNSSQKNPNRIATTGYLEESSNFKDAQIFLKNQRPDQLGQNVSVVSVNGGKNPQTFDSDQTSRTLGIEANLDTQTVLGFTAPTPSIFYTVGGSPPFLPDSSMPIFNTNEPYLEWLEYMVTLKNSQLPHVVSTSYGDDEQTVPLSYAKKVCNLFGLLGARGVSIIFSSGDDGVGRQGFCQKNDQNKTYSFIPVFPATCPYVTTVGATEGFNPEVAVSENGRGGFSSGGGFSNYFSRPKWQNTDVNKYLFSLKNTYQGLYNTTGRGYPDVAAQGAKYLIAWKEKFILVGGTSASAPTFASVISLLNDFSLSRQGGRPLGYLNPWLYSRGRFGLNDIVNGSSSGCDTDGFMAGKGWDPVTGLGTPNFKILQKLIL